MKLHKIVAMKILAVSAALMATSSPDEAAIITTLQSVGSLADQGNFEALEKLYAEEVMLDYTSLAGGEPELKSPQAIMTQWASVLPGFDRTHHKLSNIMIEINGSRASATTDFVADHYLGEMFWQVTGTYEYRLLKNDDLWQITHHTLNLEGETGSRDIFGPAIENATANPNAYILRQKTRQTVYDLLHALETKDMDKFASVWAEDAVQEMPFAPENFPNRVAGKEALINHYSSWPEISGDADFTSHLVYHPMQDPEMIFVEFKGEVKVLPTERQYSQTYGGLFHVENGKITLFREYFNPIPFIYAFGLDE